MNPCRSRRARGGPQDGAAAVEFALVMPVLVLFIFGILQFGLYFYRWQGIQAMAHEGARGGSVGLTVAQITDRIQNAMAIPVDFDDVRISVVLIDETTDSEVDRINGKTVDAGEQATALCEGVANPRDHTLRVELSLSSSVNDYGVFIPLWGSLTTDYGSASTFGCENAS